MHILEVMNYTCNLHSKVDIGPAGSRAMGKGISGLRPGPVLEARAFPVPIPKVCTS